MALLRSGALGLRGTAQIAWLLGTISRRDPSAATGRSVTGWADGLGLAPEAWAMLLALIRLATYVDDPHSLDAGAALTQLQLALGGGVEYLDGGWQTLVDQLDVALAAVGVAVRRRSRVRSIDRIATDDRWIVSTDLGTTRLRRSCWRRGRQPRRRHSARSRSDSTARVIP